MRRAHAWMQTNYKIDIGDKRYYYLYGLAVKVPLGTWALAVLALWNLPQLIVPAEVGRLTMTT